MKVENWPLDKIIPYARNPRNNEEAVAGVAASIKEFGARQCIVVDKDGVIIAGHTRLKAAQRLGMAEFPVHVAEGLTKAQIKAYRLADNKVAEKATWDNDMLKVELEELSGMDFQMDGLGFDPAELDALMCPHSEPCGDAEPQIDKAAELAEKWGVKRGQLWQLGNHRMLCGDSTSKEDVEKALDGAKPMLMVTDPPYGVEYDANWRNESDRANGKPYGAIAVGKVENDDRADWSEAWALFSGDVAYVWHAGSKSPEVAQSLIVSGFELRNLIVWAKSNFAISRGHYHHKHEPCWYVYRKGQSAGWIGDRSQTTLWDIDKPQKSETGHSTQKPIECMARPIRNHDSEFVYEPFSGSGTTIIACEQLGRKCRAIEISPAYVAVAIQRWADATGGEPKLIG